MIKAGFRARHQHETINAVFPRETAFFT